MRIGVIGGGVVGHATARCYMESHEVRVWDMLPARRTHPAGDVLECDIIFICLPTPQKMDSLECDTSAVDSFLLSVGGTSLNLVLKSTVPIGYTRSKHLNYRLPNLVHSPEFLTARCAVTDAQMPARNIIGVPRETKYADVGSCERKVFDLYYDRFPGALLLQMSSDESEAVKLMLNGFFAVKVAYLNEMNLLASKLGLDWSRVMEGILSDGRIAHSHTQVPGPDGKYGFGGECLPKDLASLIQCMTDSGALGAVSMAARVRNKFDRERA